MRELLVLTLLALNACASPAKDVASEKADDREWWETAVIYQIYPRSFKDSNGDGIGDLKGITSKLEHLKDIGVGAVWLSPIYPSPQADFGYDISNFTDIDPKYGTMEDFEELTNKAHELGLKVVLDFVPNHSSPDHKWFEKSVNKEEPYTDFYIWHAGSKNASGAPIPPNNWNSVFRYSAWEYNDKRKEFYLHQFAVGQPDLNFANPKVVEEMKEALRFWMRKGVDGFRVDAVPHLFEDPDFKDEVPSGNSDDPTEHAYLIHNYTTNLDPTYDMVTQWRKVLDEPDFGGHKLMMTEAYATMDQTLRYYGTKEKPGAHFSFNFLLITNLNRASNAEDFKKTIDSWMSRMDDFHRSNWVIGNHDQNRVAALTRYGPELADGMNMISLMLPGTAMTYNGEEIGMEDTYIRWDETLDPQAINKGEAEYLAASRDPERTPFQWDDSLSAGFSTNAKTWLPVNPNFWRLNLKAQKEAEHSHYHVYKSIIEARKHPTVQAPRNYEVKHDADKTVLVLIRRLEGQDTFAVVVNLGSQEKEINLKNFDLGEMKVWIGSVNSNLKAGSTVSTIKLSQKASVLLTSGQPPKPNSSSIMTFSSTILISLSLATILSCLRY